MTTILEALQNAQINFETIGRMGMNNQPIFQIAMSQLDNAIAELEAGKSADDQLPE